MRYLSFFEKLRDFTVFSLADIRMIDPLFHRRRLNEWQDKGYIRKIVRGYYMFADIELSETVLFEIANLIYGPSYVSLETALAYYGLVPESAYGIVSVSTRKTSRFATGIATFSYRSVAKRAFFGYTILERGKTHVKIAEIEKALLDFLYLRSDMTTADDFESLRIDRDAFQSKISFEKLGLYTARFGTKQLEKRLTGLRRYLDNA